MKALLLLLLFTSCTVVTRPVQREYPPKKKHMCTEKYHDKHHHCRHDHGKHKGHHKHKKHH